MRFAARLARAGDTLVTAAAGLLAAILKAAHFTTPLYRARQI